MTSDRHSADQDVLATCVLLAESAERRIVVLEGHLAEGEAAADGTGSRTWNSIVRAIRETMGSAIAHRPEAGAVLLSELHDLAMGTHETMLAWTLLKQGAMVTRDTALLADARSSTGSRRGSR